MSIRFIVRPQHIRTTPNKLKEVLGARRTVVNPSGRDLSTDLDFFIAYPRPGRLSYHHPDYAAIQEFYADHKLGQRRRLVAADIPVPNTHGLVVQPDLRPVRGPYVVRPLRHRAGQGWRITTDQEDYIRGREYLAEIFPKKWEYRVVYCRGKHVVTYIKRVPSGVGILDAWNHTSGSRFVTVNNGDNDRLRNTDAYDKLELFSVIKRADLIAADIMLAADLTYAVCELNFAPAITMPHVLDKIKEIVGVA